jgi:hypothetical protein
MQIKFLQALAAIPSIDSEAVQQRLDRVRTFYELLNLPFEVHHLNYTYILFLVFNVFYTTSFAVFAWIHRRT